MYNGISKRDVDASRNVVVAVIFFIYLLGGCAKSHQKTVVDGASDSVPTEIKDSSIFTPDSEQEEANEESDALDGVLNPSESGDVDSEIDISDIDSIPDPPEPPAEVQEAIETLNEPDFSQPLDEIATERCGYIFKAESTINRVSSVEGTKTTIETRVFDKAGHLVAAEIESEPDSDADTAPFSDTRFKNPRRLQIDYDQDARPTRVRISPAYNYPESTFKGSVIETTYQSDGSSQSLYVSDEVELIRKVYDDQYGRAPARGDWFFCDWLRFDSRGNLIDRKWNCSNPTTVQTRTYDERGRLLSDRGYYLEQFDEYQPLPRGWQHSMQKGQWRIEIDYDDINNRATMVWLGPEESSVYYSVSGMTPPDEPIEHRLVRSYDDSGQPLVRVEYDHENDGTLDEQISYSYEDGELLTKEVDFWIDGVLDIVEIHTRSSNHHRIERRNMTAENDLMYSSQTMENELIHAYSDVNSTLPPQSRSIIELERDGQSRVVAVHLEAQWIDYYVGQSGRWENAVVAESWYEMSVYDDRGYVSEKELIWEPSESLLDARAKDASPSKSEVAPFIFRGDAVSTTCTLTSLCDAAEVVLPEDQRLLACEVGVVFSQYRIKNRIPSLNQDDLYTVPPYDRLPGIQKALKRDTQSLSFPRAPYIQDIVGYL